MANPCAEGRALSHLESIQFFQSPAHACSYLEGRQATTVFADPERQISTEEYSALSGLGFRRSGPYIYKPYCQTCQACVPTRVPVSDFFEGRRHRRIRRLNADLSMQITPPRDNETLWLLYQRYIRARHADGDMYPPSREQFSDFLVVGRPEARFIEFSLDGHLIAVAVVDWLSDSLSAIYTFFDPSASKRSLGTFAILELISRAKHLGLSYVYLGYWIEQSPKMNYKGDFLPQERLGPSGWQRYPIPPLR
jgi:arginine-tRNA-protein transferase